VENHNKNTFNNLSPSLIDKDLSVDLEKKYKELFESSRDCIVSVDKTGKIIEFNPAFRAMLGYLAEELLNLTYEDLTPAKWHKIEKRILCEQVDKRGYSDLYEKEYIKKDGQIISVELMTYLRYDKEGITSGYWAIVRDITEKKLEEEKLIEAQQLLSSILSNSPVGIAKIRERVIIWVNDMLCRLTGYTKDELEGMNTLIAFEDMTEYERVGRVAYEEGFVETRVLKKDGTSFDAHIYVAPTDSYSHIAIVIDVTRQKETERRAKAILDQTFQFIGILDNKGRVLEVNKTALDFVGVHARDVMDKPFWDTPWWRHSKEAQNKIRTAIVKASKGEFVRFEARGPGNKGKTRFFDFSIKPVMDEHNKVIYLIVEGRDITELNQIQRRLEMAEEALQESEQRLKNIIQFLPDATLAIDSDGKVIVWNKAIEEMTGVKSEDMIGKGDYEYAVPFYGEKRPILVDLLFKPDPEIESRYDFVTKKGDKYFVEVFLPRMYGGKGAYVWALASKLYDRHGNVIGAIESIRDITDRKNAESLLQASEEKYRSIYNNIIEGIFQTTPEGVYISANPALLKMFGYSSLEELQSEIKDIRTQLYVNPKDRDDLSSRLEKIGHVEGFETQLKKRDGTIIWVSMNTRAVRDSEGKTLYYEGTMMDITERKQAEIERENLQIQLMQSQKMEALGTLTGGIAHDFNNILTALMGYATLMQIRMSNDDPLRVYVDQILASSEKAAQLTKSLLAFSRKQPMSFSPVKLNDIIKGTEKILKRLLTEDINLKVELTSSDNVVMADAIQIDQILFNLASNARDAMPRGGILTIETKNVELPEKMAKAYGLERGGLYALLIVSDTGIGMDETTRKKAFEPFFTTKGPGKGTGLGLSTVYGIVKQHNGHINVYSEPGRGTTFHIYLPIEINFSDKEEKAPIIIKGRGETILIAEDNEEARNLLKSILLQYDYKVLETKDGEEAVKTFMEKKDIDLLILDSVMPVKNGREAYEEIKKTDPNIKVLFTSGYTEDIILSKGIQEGEFDFIQKPFSPQEILMKVRNILDRCI